MDIKRTAGVALAACTAIGLLAATPIVMAKTKKSEPKSAARPATASSVDINAASQKELEALPGIGAATAKKIVAGRPYASVSDLSKAGVSAATIAAIAPRVTVGPARAAAPVAPAPPAAKATTARAAPAAHPAAAPSGQAIDVNSATEKELEALPGVGPATAKKIVSGRPYSSVADLARAGVNEKTLQQISPMVTVGASGGHAHRALQPVSAPAPDTAAAAAPAAAPAAAASTRPARVAPAAPQSAPPAGSGMVWVNLETKVYHHEGDRWYGNTKNGKYMAEDEAIKAGYRAAKTERAKNEPR